MKYRVTSSCRLTYVDFESLEDAKAFIQKIKPFQENILITEKLTGNIALSLKF